jgi:quinol-cytochrome oxidoreductase complex cytochrome b subunit
MVITNLLGAIPLIGNDLVYLLWGDFSIGDSTIKRFYSLHYTLPFLIVYLTILHFIILHEYGSNNPLGVQCANDSLTFTPYYIKKDL